MLYCATQNCRALRIEASRLLVYQSAWRASAGLSYGKESAMAKLSASETAMCWFNQEPFRGSQCFV